MNGKEILIHNQCTTTCISTCEKNTYEANKIKLEPGAEVLHNSYDQHLSINNAFSAREINLEDIMLTKEHHLDETKMFKNFTDFNPTDYLRFIESQVPEELVSSNCLEEIKNLTKNFTGNLTSFFGFESKLNNLESNSDYMFAISSKHGEREALFNYLSSNDFPEKFKKQAEWKRVTDFVNCWTDNKSSVYDKILGIWFEFDIVDSTMEIPTPNIFLHTISINKSNNNIQWLTEITLPFLIGQNLSSNIEKQFLNSIKKLPKDASLFSIGLMLSRPNYGMRIVVKRLKPKQIVPYLKSLGWSDESNELSLLINELEKYANRIVLSFDIMETGIGPKIGIECGFYPKNHDEYAPEPRWKEFLDFLVSNNLCLPEKSNALLDFVLKNESQNSFIDNKQPLIISTKIKSEDYISTLTRQIGHIKIVYKTNQPLEVKAYYGARLFSIEQTHYSKMIQ